MANENPTINSDLSNILNPLFCDCLEKIELKKCYKFPYRLFYFVFTPRQKRKAYKKQVNLIQKKQVAQDWEIFLSLYFKGKLNKFNIKPKKQFNHQNIIWQYWGQGIDGNLPDIVQLCFKSVDKYKDDFIVIRLDDNNLSDYLDLPEFVFEKRKNPIFKPAFFADLLRLALLYCYGGIWIDATVLLTSPIDNNIKNQGFFMFSRNENAINKDFWCQYNSDYFGWHNEHYVNVLNSFIVAKKNNRLVGDCLQIMLNYWYYQNHISHYFFFQIMFDVLIKKYGDNYSFNLKIDDTLTHLLISQFNEPFNQENYQNILSQTNIHKLTYIKECKNGSYYEHIKELF